jgi:enoyl-CoA hydratase
MTDFHTLRDDLHGSILVITLNRPGMLNRIDAPAHAELTAVLRGLRTRDYVRCVVLASTGKAFSAGGDLQDVVALQADPTRRQAMIDAGRTLFTALLDTAVPVVVAMQGDAHGLGATIVLTCDAVVAARTARISDAHVPMGLVAGDGGCVVWPQAAGLLRAKRHLLTGDPLTATEALAMGLITDLVEAPDDVLPAALALAQKLAALPPRAVQGTKQALNLLLKQRASEVFELALALEATTMQSSDVLEAVDAFLHKRPAVFTGR